MRKRKVTGESCISILIILAMTAQAWATVFTNPAAIAITDATTIGSAAPYPASTNVSGLTGNITNITVTVKNLTSTFPDDVDVLLVSPTGANLILMSDTGGSDDITNTYITFDDAAASSLPDATTLISGTYKPTNIGTGDTFNAPAPAPSANTTLAAAFNGTNPNGVWNFFFVDDLGADMSWIGNGFDMTITTTGSPATTFTNLTAFGGGDGGRGRAATYASTIITNGLVGAITDLNVTLTNLNHLNPDDLDILLVGPTGKRIFLTSDAGGTTDVVNQTLTFDDSAAATIPDAGPMVTGTVKPTNFGTGDTILDITPPYPYPSTAGSATLASVFNGTDGNGIWKLYIVDDATTSAGDLSGGWSIDITVGGVYGAKRFTSADFEGDGRTDVSIYRPSDSNWWLRASTYFYNQTTKWGTTNDVPIPGDYDGDHFTDFAVFRPSNNTWIILNSQTLTISGIQWGIAGDALVPADYDGDGKVDVATWRSADGNWYVRQSATGTVRVVHWGVVGDIPMRGHFGGTNGADFAVFRPLNSTWYVLANAGSPLFQLPFGLNTDKLVPADYDGDGKTDVAVWRPSDGNWWVLNSGSLAVSVTHNGAAGDIAVPGDYDGDSKADAVVWRSTEAGWYLYNSGTPYGAAALRQDSWGLPSDIALPATYLPPQ